MVMGIAAAPTTAISKSLRLLSCYNVFTAAPLRKKHSACNSYFGSNVGEAQSTCDASRRYSRRCCAQGFGRARKGEAEAVGAFTSRSVSGTAKVGPWNEAGAKGIAEYGEKTEPTG